MHIFSRKAHFEALLVHRVTAPTPTSGTSLGHLPVCPCHLAEAPATGQAIRETETFGATEGQLGQLGQLIEAPAWRESRWWLKDKLLRPSHGVHNGPRPGGHSVSLHISAALIRVLSARRQKAHSCCVQRCSLPHPQSKHGVHARAARASTLNT